jgi:cell division protein FtsL
VFCRISIASWICLLLTSIAVVCCCTLDSELLASLDNWLSTDIDSLQNELTKLKEDQNAKEIEVKQQQEYISKLKKIEKEINTNHSIQQQYHR